MLNLIKIFENWELLYCPVSRITIIAYFKLILFMFDKNLRNSSWNNQLNTTFGSVSLTKINAPLPHPLTKQPVELLSRILQRAVLNATELVLFSPCKIQFCVCFSSSIKTFLCCKSFYFIQSIIQWRNVSQLNECLSFHVTEMPDALHKINDFIPEDTGYDYFVCYVLRTVHCLFMGRL